MFSTENCLCYNQGMKDKHVALTEAVQGDKIRTWKFNFINMETNAPTEIQVTGASLASYERVDGENKYYEAMALTDNAQFFYLFMDQNSGKGRYYYVDEIDQIKNIMPGASDELINQAKANLGQQFYLSQSKPSPQ